LFSQIVEEGQTWFWYWIVQRMSSLLDKAVNDLLGCEHTERRAQVGYPIEGH
jgi:hypothetical protein